MKIKIITTGEPKLSFAKEGFLEYIKRLGGYHKVEVIHLSDHVKDEKIVSACGQALIVALDENGKEFRSKELADLLNQKSLEGYGEITFVVGGPDGHSDEIKKHAHVLMSMSRLTFPHDLALMILAEALYRASTINNNHPYHRN